MQSSGEAISSLSVLLYIVSAVTGFVLALALALVRERSRFVTEKRLLSVERLRMASVELLDIVALVLASEGQDSQKLTKEAENRLGKAYAELRILANRETFNNAEDLRKRCSEYLNQTAPNHSQRMKEAIEADRDRFVASVRKQLDA